MTKSDVEKHLRELDREITIEELTSILDSTIKEDNLNKTITFIACLNTFTEQDQMNIGFTAESSSGKSYIPLEIASYFPENCVEELAYTSPTMFFHEEGVFDEDRKINVIDKSRKIIIFIDQPHDQLLQKIRPLLSHDRKRLNIKITDRNTSGKHYTKVVELIGYPTVIFSSTMPHIDDQERTRILLLSPEVTQEKIKASIQLLRKKESNLGNWRKIIEEDPKRQWLKTRVSALEAANIDYVHIPEEVSKEIESRFFREHKYLIPRHTRDFSKLLKIVKGISLLNFPKRERIGNSVISTKSDAEIGYNMYMPIAESNELGIPPEIMKIFRDVWAPLIRKKKKLGELIANTDLQSEYYRIYHKTISPKRREKITEVLVEAGLLEKGYNDPDDRRKLTWDLIETEEAQTKMA